MLCANELWPVLILRSCGMDWLVLKVSLIVFVRCIWSFFPTLGILAMWYAAIVAEVWIESKYYNCINLCIPLESPFPISTGSWITILLPYDPRGSAWFWGSELRGDIMRDYEGWGLCLLSIADFPNEVSVVLKNLMYNVLYREGIHNILYHLLLLEFFLYQCFEKCTMLLCWSFANVKVRKRSSRPTTGILRDDLVAGFQDVNFLPPPPGCSGGSDVVIFLSDCFGVSSHATT